MRRKAELLLVIVAALLAGYMLRRPPIPAPASNMETTVPIPAPRPVEDAAPEPQPVVTPLVESMMPTVEDFWPQSAPTPIPASPVVALVPDSAVPKIGAEAVTPAEEEELRAIDTYAAQERQRIETWYSNELAGLKAQLEQRLQKLAEKDKLAWAQFYQRANETWSTTSGYEDVSVHDYGYGSAHGYGSRVETTTTSVIGNPAGEYAAISAWIKESKQATQDDFVKAQEGLAWMRRYKLATIQEEVDRRKAVMAFRKSRGQAEAARRLSGDQTPRVEAVTAITANRFCAMIGDAFVSEGDTVKGYRVRKIRPDSVEFEKDGKAWVQKVN